MCHIIWLKNRTSTKVLNGLTSYQITFRQKPDLSHVHEWGSEVYARTEQKNKLKWWVDKIRWMGINNKSENTYPIYWLMKQIITVKCHIYWKSFAAWHQGGGRRDTPEQCHTHLHM